MDTTGGEEGSLKLKWPRCGFPYVRWWHFSDPREMSDLSPQSGPKRTLLWPQTTPSPRLPPAPAHLRRYPRELVRTPQMPHRDVRELVGQHRPLLVRHPLAPLRVFYERTLERLGIGARLGVAPLTPPRLIARIARPPLLNRQSHGAILRKRPTETTRL